MGYSKTTWLKRIVQFPNRYLIDGEASTITPSEGDINQEGTPFTEDNLNKLETQYDEAASDLTAHRTNVTPPGVHRWTLGKLLKGAGAGADPTEIDSTIATYGFYVGADTVNRAIPHNLGKTPALIRLWQGAVRHWIKIPGRGTLAMFEVSLFIESGAVTDPDATDFYVGNAANYRYSANENGIEYWWVAIG